MLTNINIAMQQKTLYPTITATSTSAFTLGEILTRTILGQSVSGYVDSYAYDKNSGLYTGHIKPNYCHNLNKDYIYSTTDKDQGANGMLTDIIGSFYTGFTGNVYTAHNWNPANILSKNGSNYEACDSRGNLVSQLIGWTSIIPTWTINIEGLGSSIIVAVQRGQEQNAVTITAGEFEYQNYGTAYKSMELLTDSDKSYYINGSTANVASGSTDATQPATYYSGVRTDNSGQQTLTYSYGLLTSEAFASTDGTVVSSINYTYSAIYPPANLTSKSMTRTETKDNSDVPSPSDITSFPYKVTETVVNTSAVTNTMADNGKDLIQNKEETTCVKSGYNITDTAGTHVAWSETESHKTITYYSDMGQQQWSVSVYKDDVFVSSQVVTGNPGAKASPFAIKEGSTYAGSKGGKVKPKRTQLSGKFLGSTSVPVADQSTLDDLVSDIEGLNGKTEERISGAYLGSTLLTFNHKITFNGNIYFLESNSVSVTTKGVRQSIVLVRWY